MAYGLKYRLTYCDELGTPLRLEIHQQSYTGAVIPLTGTGDTFVLNYKEGTSIEDPISASSAMINIIETGGFNYSDLYSADERTFKVLFYVNNTVYWSGWLLPDYIQGEYKRKAAISISATDTLSTLSNVPYLKSDGSVYTGRQRLLDVIVNCLSYTGLDLNISVLNDITCNEWSAPLSGQVNSILESTYIHSERFSDAEGNVLSCLDILQSVMTMLASTLRQEGGKWSIFNIEQRAKQIGNVDLFDPTGTRIIRTPIVPKQTTVGNTKRNAVSLSGMTERNDPVYYNTEIYSEHGPYMPLIKNVQFNGFANGQYPEWTNVNGFNVTDSDIQVLRYNRDGTVNEQKQVEVSRPVIRSGIVETVTPTGNVLNVASSPYMKSSVFPALMSEKIVFKIQLEGFENDRQYIVIKAGDYYLRQDGSWSKETNRGYVVFTLPLNGGRPGNTRPDAVQQSFEITTAELPVSADVELRIYGHKQGGTANRFQLALLNLELIKESSNVKLAKGIVFSTINPGFNTYIPDRKLTLFSDYVSSGIAYSKTEGTGTRPPRGGAPVSNVIDFLSSTLTNREGVYTASWSRLGKTESSYLNLLASRSIASMHARITKTFQGDVRKSLFDSSDTFLFDCNDGDVFLFLGGQIRTSGAVISGSWTKVDLYSVTNTNESVYASFEGDEKGKGTGVAGIGSGGSGSGSGTGGGASSETLQSVTDRGSITDRIIEVQGTRNSRLLTIPVFANAAEKALWSGEGDRYLMLGDDKAKAGYSDEAGDSEKWNGNLFADFLDQSVRTTDEPKFKGTGSPDFASGFAGHGWKMDPDGNHLTVDNLTVRKRMSIYELIINQIRATNGSLWVSDSIKADSVEEMPDANHFKCFIDTDDNNIAVPFRVNDIVRCQNWTGRDVKYYTAIVTEVENEYFVISVIEGESIPEAGDDIVRIGNTTDPNRQGALYLTASDDGAPYMDVLDGVASADLTGKVKVRIGKLDGIVDALFGQLGGYGAYLQNIFAIGRFVQRSGDGVTEKIVPIYKGAYKLDEPYYPADQVTYEGSTYINKVFAPSGVLPTDETYWELYVEKGGSGDPAKFITLSGDQTFVYGADINKTVDKEVIAISATEHNFTGEPGDRLWEYYNGVAWVPIPNTFNMLTYVLSHDAAIWNGQDSVSIRYRVGELVDQMTIVKLYSGESDFKVVIRSVYGDHFFNGNIDTTLSAEVYWGGERITDTIPETGFTWTRVSNNPAEDEIWNFHEGKARKSVEIDHTDVYKKAVFNCDVEINL